VRRYARVDRRLVRDVELETNKPFAIPICRGDSPCRRIAAARSERTCTDVSPPIHMLGERMSRAS